MEAQADTNEAQIDAPELATLRQLIADLRKDLDERNPNLKDAVAKTKQQLNLFPSAVYSLTDDEIRDICAGVLSVTSTTLAASEEKEKKATDKAKLKSMAAANPDDVL